jgi:phosphatidylglycerol---prolipoprotein diacylglyceryl transferase
MKQELFTIPFLGWPIFGYGMMLFLAYVFCTWLASWLGKKEGIPPQKIYDLGVWLFICGIIGARVTYMIHFRDQVEWTLASFVSLWDGGIEFYGAAIGGVVGYCGAYFFMFRKLNISTLKIADIIAPSAALGLCLGRVGCLLNGCCYGNVACPDCLAICFPLPTSPRYDLVNKGFQTAAGFTLSDTSDQVALVEPGSPAARAGLRDGDEVLAVDGKKGVRVDAALGSSKEWPRGKNDLVLTVRHADGNVEDIGPFVPRTIGLHPTQIYESISTGLLFLLLLAFYPYRRHAGEVMVLFMLCYAVHRFINETLRNDTQPVAFDMTLSQNGSIIVLVAGLVLGVWLWRKTPRIDAPLAPPLAPNA